jgi:hypothetical protein
LNAVRIAVVDELQADRPKVRVPYLTEGRIRRVDVPGVECRVGLVHELRDFAVEGDHIVR